MAKINWMPGLMLEQEVSRVIQKQEEYGIYFDTPEANRQILWLESEKERLYAEVRGYLTYDVVPKETTIPKGAGKSYEVANFGSYELKEGEKNFVKKIYLKNGEYVKSIISHFDDYNIVSGPFSRVVFEEPSISKRLMIIKQLLRLGWKPKEFTKTKQPKITIEGLPVDTIEKIGPFGEALSLWYTYNHRQSQITGFLPHVRPDGRISAQCNPCGTNTFRARHRVVANIPRPTSVFGYEMRSLFRVAPGRVFVGADVAGLELRMLAHHMKDNDYIYQILEGDIHVYNMNMAGLRTRDQAKTFIYGFLYGAGNPKIGEIVNGSAKAGGILKNTFLNSLPKLKLLMQKVQKFAERQGFVPSIDGRKIWIRSFEGRVLTHTALNALLQANGSIVTKRAMVIASDEIKRRGLDAHQILFYHDEFAYDCKWQIAYEVGEILEDSMRLAGEYYDLNIPIAGDATYSNDWSIH